mmetsp:Transcript_469/g.900  ORF Transcript_469/g.900 Transcript_469/m.900 type:complete len:145 (-) Transcript_469:330-764(-)|eukprot:CAMPEP_0119298962 /NCGR_PEP_ID=MMETSP1333-20130426/1092_1 /TAXON_ID=418940 /ORGANISM="Scyphosphaera apsteinii, Strain RCC1455" /LENGTH=144 /DNA_ID=CAMNT_0007300219 /DNA_START=84 /DNA_END=518 /DNA_ORIENTATION=+
MSSSGSNKRKATKLMEKVSDQQAQQQLVLGRRADMRGVAVHTPSTAPGTATGKVVEGISPNSAAKVLNTSVKDTGDIRSLHKAKTLAQIDAAKAEEGATNKHNEAAGSSNEPASGSDGPASPTGTVCKPIILVTPDGRAATIVD